MNVYTCVHELGGRNAPGVHCALHALKRYQGNRIESFNACIAPGPSIQEAMSTLSGYNATRPPISVFTAYIPRTH